MHAIVYHKDPGARLFGSPGPDGSIDALSGDGSTVYQAKHRNDWGIENLIKTARNEAAKIRKYRDDPSHTHHDIWRGVTQWIMVTNCANNAGRERRWRADVVPEFQALGLDADWWTLEHLEGQLLYQYPGIRRAFFEAEDRIFLTLNEARESISQHDVHEAGMAAPFVGRDEPMTRFRAFLADSQKRILPVHGPGGIGKTRFLWECGRDTLTSISGSVWDVFWVNVASMAHSEHWSEHLIPERPTLLLIDEPDNALTLQRLDEQMASRCKNWRAVVATRTSFDPIMEWLKNRRHRAVADAIELPKLERDPAVALAASLLRAKLLRDLPEEHSRVLELARQVTRICDDHPVWIGIAVELLEENGSTALLPSDTRGVASQYLDEAIEHAAKRTGTSSAALKALVRWLALFQPLNIETDRDALDFVAREASFARVSQVRNALTALAERRIVRERDHVCELKPDVMSDSTLRAWLVDTNRPQGCSHDADDLIQRMVQSFEGEPFPKLLQVIRMLARLELQCRQQGNGNVDLVGAIVAQTRKLAEEPMAAARLKAVSIAKAFHMTRPGAVAEMSRLLRQSRPANDSTIESPFGARCVTNEQVLAELPDLVFAAAAYALDDSTQAAIWAELLELARGINNERVRSLLSRLTREDSYALRSYAEVAGKSGMEWLRSVQRGQAPQTETLGIIRALVEPQVAVRREFNETDGLTFRFSPFHRIGPQHPGFRVRTELLEVLWELVSDTRVASEYRLLAWELLSESHREANEFRRHGQQDAVIWDKEVRCNLERVLSWLKSHSMPLHECLHARRLWDWHSRFDKDDEVRLCAAACDEELRREPAMAPYADVYFAEREAREEISSQRGMQLAHAASSDEIWSWVSGAIDHFAKEASSLTIHTLLALGRTYFENPAIEKFGLQCMRSGNAELTTMAARMVDVALTQLRSEGDEVRLHELMHRYLEACPDVVGQRLVLAVLYDPIGGRKKCYFSSDITLLNDSLDELWVSEHERPQLFNLLGGLCHVDWERFTAAIARCWKGISTETAGTCYARLADGLYWAVHEQSNPLVAQWLIEQLIHVPNPSSSLDLSSQTNYQYGELIQPARGTISIGWLTDFLRQHVAHHSSLRQATRIWRSVSLAKSIRHIQPGDDRDPAIRTEVERLIALVGEPNSDYFRSEFITSLDPDGILVPRLIADRLQGLQSSSIDELLHWSCYAAPYSEGSDAWRAIALPACEFAKNLDEDKRHLIYSCLHRDRSQVPPSKPGNIDPYWMQEVARVESLEKQEAESALRDYWHRRVRKVHALAGLAPRNVR